MLPAARIDAAIELMGDVLAADRPADATVSAYFRSRRYIGSKDRAAIMTRIYRIMRCYHRLKWWAGREKIPFDARAMVVADLMFEREQNAASLEKIFSGEKFSPAPLKENERKFAAALEKQDLSHPDMSARERAECPEWAFDALQKTLGKGFEREMEAMLHPAPMDIRANILKTSRDDLLKVLQKDGFDAAAGALSPWAIRVLGRPPLAQHPLFKEGLFEIQDEGSQLVALAAAAKPGEQVVDFCAGAGGKTLALGATMQNKGRIVAMDVLGGRLNRAKVRFRRAGLHNIETRELSSERDKWVKRHQDHFDLVLVDAPCTGTGTWRRDPDKRWRMLGPGISDLVPLQKDILESAARLVKKGGRLVYATCSLLPDENENQVKAFLAARQDFALAPVEGFGDFLKVTPATHQTDGFFAAVMRRA